VAKYWAELAGCGTRRWPADNNRYYCRIYARLVHQPDPRFCGQSTVFSLGRATAYSSPPLGNIELALLASSALTTVVSGRYAVSSNAAQAVREDW
jgi:hypothetical protein